MTKDLRAEKKSLACFRYSREACSVRHQGARPLGLATRRLGGGVAVWFLQLSVGGVVDRSAISE